MSTVAKPAQECLDLSTAASWIRFLLPHTCFPHLRVKPLICCSRLVQTASNFMCTIYFKHWLQFGIFSAYMFTFLVCSLLWSHLSTFSWCQYVQCYQWYIQCNPWMVCYPCWHLSFPNSFSVILVHTSTLCQWRDVILVHLFSLSTSQFSVEILSVYTFWSKTV